MCVSIVAACWNEMKKQQLIANILSLNFKIADSLMIKTVFLMHMKNDILSIRNENIHDFNLGRIQ